MPAEIEYRTINIEDSSGSRLSITEFNSFYIQLVFSGYPLGFEREGISPRRSNVKTYLLIDEITRTKDRILEVLCDEDLRPSISQTATGNNWRETLSLRGIDFGTSNNQFYVSIQNTRGRRPIVINSPERFLEDFARLLAEAENWYRATR